MLLQRKTKIILALIISSVFLFQNCATWISGKYQKVPITSNPSGAKIIVDGEEIGYAPLNLKLKRKKGHIIRIEKQGYNLLEIRIIRKISGSLVGYIVGNTLFAIIPAFAWVAWIAYDNEREPLLRLLRHFVGWTVGLTLVDFLTGANFTLSPKELNVTLEKQEGKPQPNFILIDAENFQNIKWIRIKCADSDEGEIVNLD